MRINTTRDATSSSTVYKFKLLTACPRLLTNFYRIADPCFRVTPMRNVSSISWLVGQRMRVLCRWLTKS